MEQDYLLGLSGHLPELVTLVKSSIMLGVLPQPHTHTHTVTDMNHLSQNYLDATLIIQQLYDFDE